MKSFTIIFIVLKINKIFLNFFFLFKYYYIYLFFLKYFPILIIFLKMEKETLYKILSIICGALLIGLSVVRFLKIKTLNFIQVTLTIYYV